MVVMQGTVCQHLSWGFINAAKRMLPALLSSGHCWVKTDSRGCFPTGQQANVFHCFLSTICGTICGTIQTGSSAYARANGSTFVMSVRKAEKRIYCPDPHGQDRKVKTDFSVCLCKGQLSTQHLSLLSIKLRRECYAAESTGSSRQCCAKTD